MREHRRSKLMVVLAVSVLVACGNGTGNQNDRNTPPPSESSATIKAEQQSAVTAPAATGEIALVESTGSASLPEGIFIATPGEDNVQRDEPEPTAGPTPTPPPPVDAKFDSDGDGFYSPDEFVQAITALYPSYSWPDQYYISLDEIIERLEPMLEPNMQHEALGEYTVIGRLSQCAWGLAYLDAFTAGDDAQMTESLRQLRWELGQNPLRPSQTIAHQQEMYDEAELGDVASLQQSVSVNCDASDFSPRPAGTSSAWMPLRLA